MRAAGYVVLLSSAALYSGTSCAAIPTLSDTHEDNTEWATLLFALGSLWQNGVAIDWDAFYANEERRRIPLPTYPFSASGSGLTPPQRHRLREASRPRIPL